MQAAIDRVFRTFIFKPEMSVHAPKSDDQSRTLPDEATTRAVQLLDNYAGHLARRSDARD